MSTALLRLPPHLRFSPYQRTFSSTCKQNSTLVDILSTPPTYLLDTLRATGLPWYLVLPTSALLVRGVLTYYIATLPNHKAAQIQSNLQSLAAARLVMEGSQPGKRGEQRRRVQRLKRTGTSLVMIQLRENWLRFKTMNATMGRLQKVFGVKYVWSRWFLNFSTLIAMTEAIRMKCGSRTGLLSVVLSPVERSYGQVGMSLADTTIGHWFGLEKSLASMETAPQLSADELLAQRLEETMKIDEHGNAVYNFSALPPPPPEPSPYLSSLDPTLHTEGFAWVTDLTLPDTTFTLSIALGAILMLNIIYRPTIGGPRKPPQAPAEAPAEARSPDLGPNLGNIPPNAMATLAAPPYNRTTSNPTSFLAIFPPITNFQRLQLIFTGVFMCLSTNLPAGILLYLIPNFVIGQMQTRWLTLRYPVRAAIRPCVRPLRLRVRREWQD
ncbi:hypothetical protein LTR62_007309 [Meristemomyces frigidus]|uniref:Uncharacterized protein n=1 Tax=Meristemomyces frigidus TaxID=1508187 RepID=A0AAN7TMA6_9PEZI|nr:hypothetical protein LTR62_007309 [Meristemomyces frigidus]